MFRSKIPPTAFKHISVCLKHDYQAPYISNVRETRNILLARKIATFAQQDPSVPWSQAMTGQFFWSWKVLSLYIACVRSISPWAKLSSKCFEAAHRGSDFPAYCINMVMLVFWPRLHTFLINITRNHYNRNTQNFLHHRTANASAFFQPSLGRNNFNHLRPLGRFVSLYTLFNGLNLLHRPQLPFQPRPFYCLSHQCVCSPIFINDNLSIQGRISCVLQNNLGTKKFRGHKTSENFL